MEYPREVPYTSREMFIVSREQALAWRLCVVIQDDFGTPNDRLAGICEFVIDPGQELHFGRSPEQDIVLRYRTIARRHGHLVLDEDGRLVVVDHGTLHGIFITDVEGEHEALRSRERALLPGEFITLIQVYLWCSVQEMSSVGRAGPSLDLDDQIVWLRGISHAKLDKVRGARELSQSAPRRFKPEALHYLEKTLGKPRETLWFASAFELEQKILCKDRSGWFAAGGHVAPMFSKEPFVTLMMTHGEPFLYKLEVYGESLAIITHRYPPELVERLRAAALESVSENPMNSAQEREWRCLAFTRLLSALGEKLHAWD